ncbi:cation transporter [Noviherbaspirillum aridicola]|uniref:Cobalt transporter n=1 Tax=Noviherbaspirillum aridicola TaxID=2849687 RepID=A0ABQ4Q8W8_9BURK|nr:cation transporter [Noviherbaspirillum aridicola]GIZ53149.1 cobalt transporter [Noviherbaspirillum aridicola]
MSDCCSGGCASSRPPVDPAYRRILWIALVVNAAMFGIEIVSGVAAGSVSLLADAVDFLGDAANYAVSLFVLGMAAVWRSRTALWKGVTMGAYGLFVLGAAIWHAVSGTVPEHVTMGATGFLALCANLLVAVLLFSRRNGDANMRSVWLCTRNDAIGNVAVMLAALGVFGTGAGWPDIVVASIMALLGLSAAKSVIGQARVELRAA